MQESIRLCRDFAREMKINVWFRQGGYLFLVRERGGPPQPGEERRRAERLRPRHAHAHRPRGERTSSPSSGNEGVVAASYNPEDGVVFPWPFVWGYAQGAERLGVEIATFTDVKGFRTTGKRIDAVVTDKGEIRTHRVVNAAGAWAPEVARLLGVELPNHPHRHEICSTEPLKLWLKPLVADLSNGLYFSQSMRGRSSAASATSTCRRGSTRARQPRVPRALRAGGARDLPDPGERQGAAAVGGVLRSHAGCEPDRGGGRRGRRLLPGVGLHGARVHDGARDGAAHGAATSRSGRGSRCSSGGTCGGSRRGGCSARR